ncbi:hypothetical protein IV203_004582 [Nitzschia inconspicua]|uniref:Uncharacterized protein n=1 Tax=Nitzschia inconspicua TaxID=303405 RepID=A0A9K3PQ77_9STRA|nr:hypothetical protein IV203_004582 [Nitzschia inconspicua]
MTRHLFTVLLLAAFPLQTYCFSSTSTGSSNKIPITLADEVDTAQAFASSSFPIQPDDLIQRAKQVLAPDVGIGTKDGGKCLAFNFEFCAAVVGPIKKDAYLNALGTFKLEDSFDIHQNMFGFTVSPIQPNRVYWFSHANATLVSDFAGANVENVKEPLVFPPQCFHMDFDANGLVTEFGFYTVDRQYGNTGGLGGAFGFFYGVGKPLPIREAKPFKPSFKFRLIQWVGRMGEKLQKNKT